MMKQVYEEIEKFLKEHHCYVLRDMEGNIVGGCDCKDKKARGKK